MKFITVHEAVETISGAAIRSTSRPPQGRDHQLVRSDESIGVIVVLTLGLVTGCETASGLVWKS
jgi:hypothetical protein